MLLASSPPFSTLRPVTMTDKETQQSGTMKLVAPNEEAQHAAADEKSMTLIQAIKLYPKAVGWSVVLSSALIMEGYDLALLGSLYGSPQFNQKYGIYNSKSRKWSVPANWQSAL
jgi:SP family general alpha glucoside:H+ symporter-like MFS transporter